MEKNVLQFALNGVLVLLCSLQNVNLLITINRENIDCSLAYLLIVSLFDICASFKNIINNIIYNVPTIIGVPTSIYYADNI